MRKFLILFFLPVLSLSVLAQYKEVSGVVIDAQYNTPVPYAAIFVEHTKIGVVASNVGEFSLQVPDSLKNNRLVSVGEGYSLTYLLPEDYGHAPLRIALVPQDRETALLSPPGGAAVKPGKVVSLLSKAARFVMDDWIPLGNPETNTFDFGRIQTLPTYNPVEGVRLRAGAASNSRLSPHFFMKGYLAYGFKDQQFKYRGEAVWSFDKKAYHEDEFPKNNMRLVYENDLFSPGEMHPRSLNDLLLITYRRSVNEATYRNFAEINYEREYKNGLAHTFWWRKSRLIPQGELEFRRRAYRIRWAGHFRGWSAAAVLFRRGLFTAKTQTKTCRCDKSRLFSFTLHRLRTFTRRWCCIPQNGVLRTKTFLLGLRRTTGCRGGIFKSVGRSALSATSLSQPTI